MFFVSLKSQPNHRMEFTLKGMPFDSLRVVAYDNTKNEIVHFPCRLTHSDTWINEIPDSIWDTNDIFVLGKGNEIQKKYEYICFYNNLDREHQKKINRNSMHVFPDTSYVKIDALHFRSDTIQDDGYTLIYHNFSTIPNTTSGVKAMIKYPDFSTFNRSKDKDTVSYRSELVSYIAAVKDCPNSNFLLKKLQNNMNLYRTAKDARSVYSGFSARIKASELGQYVSKNLSKDWTRFDNDSLTNVITRKKEKITDEINKIRLICFTASWCTNCRKEIPLLKEIYNDLKEESFEMVYISVDQRDDQKSLFRKQIQEDKIPWRSLFSYPEKIEDKYMIRAYPTNMLVYPDNHTEFIDVRIQEDKEKLYRLVKNRISELINH